MKRYVACLNALLVVLALCLLVMADTYYPGTTVTSLSAVTTTGAGTVFATSTPMSKFTWDSIVAGGTATALTVNLEGSNDNFVSTTIQLDQNTSTSTASRHVVNKPVRFFRCNITTYTTNGTNATCNITAVP